MKDQPLEERFWSKVICDISTGCWLWIGAIMSKGYGSVSFGPPRGHTELAHRVAWLLTFGNWPPTWALHRCDNRRCVRPDHLFSGDQQANMDDMWAKGRGVLPKRQPDYTERARGERQGSAKLTEAHIAQMRQCYSAGTMSQQRLADFYGVSQTQMSRILRHESWRHVP